MSTKYKKRTFCLYIIIFVTIVSIPSMMFINSKHIQEVNVTNISQYDIEQAKSVVTKQLQAIASADSLSYIATVNSYYLNPLWV